MTVQEAKKFAELLDGLGLSYELSKDGSIISVPMLTTVYMKINNKSAMERYIKTYLDVEYESRIEERLLQSVASKEQQISKIKSILKGK